MMMSLFMSSPGEDLTFDFGKKSGDDWRVIVDGVMGGLSTGEKTLNKNSMIFSGSISLENNGGFSSLRAPMGTYDLSPYKTLEVRYRATGGVFTLMMETNRQFYFPYYALMLESTGEEWKTVKVNMSEVIEVKMGKPTGDNMTQKEMAEVIRIGFMKLDKKVGPFEIEVDYIKFQ